MHDACKVANQRVHRRGSQQPSAEREPLRALGVWIGLFICCLCQAGFEQPRVMRMQVDQAGELPFLEQRMVNGDRPCLARLRFQPLGGKGLAQHRVDQHVGRERLVLLQ
ncbi:hypothetical protein D3C85_1417820 [compost metagenome]